MSGTVDISADPEAPGEQPPQEGLVGPRTRLVLLAALMLFTELALIRWLGAEVFYLSYFSNFVLLGSFLGIGLGFIWAGRGRRPLYPFAPLLLGVLVLYVYLFPVPLEVRTEGLIFFDTIEPQSAIPRELVLVILFVAVAAVLAAIGDGVARAFGVFEPLQAYKLDLIGSVAGIAGFTVLSFLGARPIVWGVVIAVIVVATIAPRPTWKPVIAGVGLLAVLAPFAVEATQDDVVWSPYYRIQYEENADGGINTTVNQSPHWTQIPTEDNALYEFVYQNIAEPEGGDTLVIGAGSGNDVASALRRGATHVDAVEIDQRLVDLARDNHPDQPWSDPRVDVHVDDGRAFLERSDEEWDKILLALPDSLTLVQGASSVRLESYLFTEEAARTARDRLAPGGVFAMYNFYREDWLVDRYANTLEQAFGTPPCVTKIGDFNLSVLIASEDPEAIDCPAGSVWAGAEATSAPAPASDDHPFPYLREPSIPRLYVISAALMIAFSLAAVRLVGGPLRGMRAFADLFAMGVAFLLLETKGVVGFALFFGTTWLVNALVFIGILSSVLLSVAVSRRVTFKHPARLYIVLLAALALAYVVPPATLLDLPVVPRFLAAVTLAFFPVFTANIIFTQRFKATSHSMTAFGANLVGAMVGGVLEYSALYLGYRNLLIVVALAYGAALLLGRKQLTVAPA
ncbi:hypothetical protein PO878_11270 [Iamia majanohamensis]|uniref:PABS domain-containing protein n=1 Tax=Iamia majanohamensis TaxID=467976 RepID=A0AAF0BTR3_9ACTN|nr:hypothetical protein [Iamia majanohamensis]WCO65078.1 hypothetical protein PO878_11270 [Iamia majanohamensis]